MDKEAWRAAVHGVAKSLTGLSDWTELNWLIKTCSISDKFPKNICTWMLLFQCILKLEGKIIFRMLQQIPILDLESTFPMLPDKALFLNTKKISLNLFLVRFRRGILSLQRFCISLASSWHWLFFHRTIRMLASVKLFAITAKGGSRISHFLCSEQSENYHLGRTQTQGGIKFFR